MPFQGPIKEEALLASGRHCCLCHKFCGLKIELHHIDLTAESGEDTFDNCIPLCFDCHADMKSYDHKHPKGTKYTPSELRRHRNNWYEKVKNSPGGAYPLASSGQDAAIYHSLTSALPYEGVVDYVERQDFGELFLNARVDPLFTFVEKSRAPSLEFMDADLEGMRVDLVGRLNRFCNLISTETWPTNSKDYRAIPREWEDHQPVRFLKVIDSLNDQARDVVTSYKALVREARRRLGV